MSGLDDLLECDRQGLTMRWRRAFESTPPKHCSMLFLQKVLAHDLQCKAYGDVPKRIDKQLKAIARSATPAQPDPSSSNESLARSLVANGNGGEEPGPVTSDSQASSPVPTLPLILSPGVQLVREWNGRTWQVEVLEEGFACKGKTYRSLSAIARMITGTRWSGPRFFGLRPS